MELITGIIIAGILIIAANAALVWFILKRSRPEKDDINVTAANLLNKILDTWRDVYFDQMPTGRKIYCAVSDT